MAEMQALIAAQVDSGLVAGLSPRAEIT